MADVDPATLPIVSDSENDPQEQRPLVGALIAGYGCYVAPQEITKIETVRSGTNHYVLAHLRGQASTGEASQRHTAFLTPPLDTEEEAHRLCDRICAAMFMVLSTNPETHGAHWPTPEPPVEERFGL